MSSTGSGRMTGEVIKILSDFGFIRCNVYPDQDIYFKLSWVQSNEPMTVGEQVEFELKTYGENIQAHFVQRLREPSDAPDALAISGTSQRRDPRTSYLPQRLLDWAYLGYLPRVLSDLQQKAVREDWEFQNQNPDPERPFPILYSYLSHTFGRLVLEDKVMVNAQVRLAAFNTGLVDETYEPIYALFEPNDRTHPEWKLLDFCVAAEGVYGRNLVRYFNPLPEQAHYFDEPADLLYDVREGGPQPSWDHIVIDNIDRYPTDFLRRHCPPSVTFVEPSRLAADERVVFYNAYRRAVETDPQLYRVIKNRVSDAIDLAVKRITWNFKTAVPQYYPRTTRLSLLLPLCLVNDNRADMALVVERTESGSYLAPTVLPLDWAYNNARLVCQPNSDWLDPTEIVGGTREELD